MVREYIYSHFIVLYQTSTRSKDRLDEIILLSLDEINNRNLQRIEEDNHSREKKGEKILEIPPMKLLKIREAPRRFSKYNLVNAEESCIYYWSNNLGAHLMKPSWKEKNGVIVVDKDKIIDGARKQAAEEGNRYDNDELDAYLMKINEMHIRYHFEKTGYYYNADAYCGDWARSELSVHFNENSFWIDDLEVSRLMILSHWEVEEAWKKAESMLASRQWEMQETTSNLMPILLPKPLKRMAWPPSSINTYYKSNTRRFNAPGFSKRMPVFLMVSPSSFKKVASLVNSLAQIT